MYLVTGGAGFIGSNIVHGLNARGINDIYVVDDLTQGQQFNNIVDANIQDYADKDDFLLRLQKEGKLLAGVKAVFHLGACSSTTEWNGQFMMRNNYEYSKTLLQYCLNEKIPFIYASSAATYGAKEVFKEGRENEHPLNVYGYSKFLFDQYVRGLGKVDSQIVGMRYFNVYGPRESHKGSMASVAYHHYQQILKEGVVRLFEGSGGYGPGGQSRDFVEVGDVVAVNLWFLDHPECSGIFNVGTGRAQPFNDIANAVIQWHGSGRIEYIPFPEKLKGCYQSFTQADLTHLRNIGCDIAFKDVQTGVAAYMAWLAGGH